MLYLLVGSIFNKQKKKWNFWLLIFVFFILKGFDSLGWKKIFMFPDFYDCHSLQLGRMQEGWLKKKKKQDTEMCYFFFNVRNLQIFLILILLSVCVCVLCVYKELKTALLHNRFGQVSRVFHLASFGMSGSSMFLNNSSCIHI